MIQLIIDGETGAEVVQKMRDFLAALTPANDSQAVAAPAPRPRKPKTGDAPKEDAAAPADPSPTAPSGAPAATDAAPPSAPSTSGTETTPAPASSAPSQSPAEPPPQVDRAKLESDVRAVLTPLMAGPKAVKATELVAKYGGRVSKVADDQLQPLLDEAKQLAEAA